MKRISIVVLMVLALVLVACTTEQAGSSATQSAVAQATPEPAESGDDTVGAFPSIDTNGDPELAGRFPETVGGEPLVVQSVRGETILSFGGSAELESLLEMMDAGPEDLSMAVGLSEAGDLQVTAFRIAGTSQASLETQFLESIEESGEASGFDRQSVGGKDVWVSAQAAATGGTIFIYVKDDTVYTVVGSEGDAAEVFEALP